MKIIQLLINIWWLTMKTLITSTTNHLFSSTSSLQPFLLSPCNNYNSQQSLNLVYVLNIGKPLIWESQNGWGWKWPLAQIAQDHVQALFEGLQWEDLSGQPVPVLCHLQSTEVLHGVQRKPPVFHFVFHCVPLLLVLAVGTTDKSLAPSSLHLPFMYRRGWFPPELPLSRLKVQLRVPARAPVTLVALCWTLPSMSRSLLYWGVQNWTQHFRWDLTNAEQREGIISLDLLVIFCLMQPRIPLTLLVAACTNVWGCPSHSLHFVLNFMTFLSSHFFSLSRSL